MQLTALKIYIGLRKAGDFVGARSLVQDQSSDVVEIAMLGSSADILNLFLGRQDVSSCGVFIRRDFYVTNRILSRPMLLDGVTKEF